MGPDRLGLHRRLEPEAVAGVVASPGGGVGVEGAGEVPRQLRAFALDAHVDRGAGILAGELEELPLAAEQPERVGDLGGQGRLEVRRERQPFEPGPRVDRGSGARTR